MAGARKSTAWMVWVVRLFRYGLYLSIAIMLWWLLSNFSFVRLEKDDVSVVGISGFRRVLVERLASEEEVARGDVLVFAILDATDQRIYRASRVLAGPGDRVETDEGFYAVNGERTHVPLTKAKPLTGVLPEGRFFVVNDNHLSGYADSLRLGWIPRECVIGRFLTELPF
ncbi:MAG: S26 family signal peptidase [Planctomycetota bacterium]|jgi:signal peptidase I